MTGLARLRELLAAATAGPWEVDKDGDVFKRDHDGFYVEMIYEEADAALIVSLRNCADELLAVAEAAMVRGGPAGTDVGHYWQGGTHWYDPSSTPMASCPLCAALAALDARLGAQDKTT